MKVVIRTHEADSFVEIDFDNNEPRQIYLSPEEALEWANTLISAAARAPRMDEIYEKVLNV